jgi:hypothetical protein
MQPKKLWPVAYADKRPPFAHHPTNMVKSIYFSVTRLLSISVQVIYAKLAQEPVHPHQRQVYDIAEKNLQ